SEDDVLFGYRLQLVDLAGRIGVSAACRTFGVHRSTFYAWKHKIEREGLGALRPRERRRPRMPNQLSPLVQQPIVALALGHPGLGPRRVAAEPSTSAVGRPERLSERRLALSTPAWAEHASEAALARRRLRGAIRAAARATAGAACRGRAAGRAGRLRLLLRRPPAQHEGDGLAADRDRRLLLVHVGRS